MKRALRFLFWTTLLLMVTHGVFGQAATNTWTGADPSGYWSAPANWSPAGVPVNGNDLVFPGGLPPGDMVSTNDLSDSIFRSIKFVQSSSRHTIRGNSITLTNGTDCIVNSGTNVIACDLTFSGTPPNPTFGAYAINQLAGGSSTPTPELTVIGNVGSGGKLYSFFGRLVIRGQFTGGSLRQYGGSMALYGDNPHAVAAEVQGDATTLFVQGSQPNLNITMLWEMESAACPHLSGDGAVGDVTGCGHLTLDSTLSVKNISRGVCGTCYYNTLTIRLNGTNVGEYGKLVASGDVSLSMGSLVASAGFNPQPGQVFTIVEKTSPGPITNAFLGSEGTVTTLNGMPFRISYVGGDGNDVTLTANTPPVVTWQQPANNTAFPPGFPISLRARATDSDGTVSFVEFFATPTNGPAINLGQGTLAADGFYIREWTNPPPGQYQLRAEAVDNAGGRGISDSVQIVVVGTNQPSVNAQTRTWTGADPSGYWSAPANWSPAGVLVNGDDLVFPGGLPPQDKVSTNDLTDRIFGSISFTQTGGHTIRGNPMTLTNRMLAVINSGTNVIACDLTFSGTPSTPTTIRSSSFSSGDLTVIGNVGGGSLYMGLGFWRLVIIGQFTGGSLFMDWYTTLALYGDNPYAVSVTNVAGTLLVQGSQPNLNMSLYYNLEDPSYRASLSGDGAVGDVADFGFSRITPDSTLSVKNINGGHLLIRLNGTNVGEYGRLVASGDVTLSGGSLSASAGFHPQPGQVFTIIDKTSPGPITTVPGYDTNLFGPEGTIITLNGTPFRLSYIGGDGNDVTLTALGFVPIPIPGLPAVSGSSVAWGDYDNDGRLDFLLAGNGTGAGSQLWRNTGSGFSNVTDSVAPGLPRVYQGSVAWGDYDNDGRLDLLLTGSDISQLWRNTGSGFSNVTASVAPGLPGLYAGSVAWGDYDNDGRLDFLLTGSGYAGGYVSQLWRNTGSGFSNVTASVAPGLPGASRGSWGDYDNDGRLDLLLTGYPPGGQQLWRNTGSGFSNVTASVAPGLPVAAYGSAWGDYDNDGRLDFLLNGSGIVQLWRNTGAAFSNVTASVVPGLRSLYGTSVAWGDFDNDGRLDFLLTGTTDGEVPPVGGHELSQLWRNTGAGFSNVTASVAPGLPGVSSGSMAWGDFDNDGRLDFLLTGAGKSQLWRNDMPVASNAPPAAPTGLSSTLSGATVSLSWNPPADDRTPSTGLNYNLRIGTTPGASDVLAPMALTDGLRLLPALGNAQAGTNAFVFNVATGRDYYWSVQAVDTSFAGSPFAIEQQFTIAPRVFQPLLLGNGHFQFSFTNQSSAVYEVLGATNVSLPVAQWSVLGLPTHLGGGRYQFTDTLVPNHPQRFYLVRQQ